MILKTFLSAFLTASSVLAQGLAYPVDLQPGVEFRVLLVTDGLRDATSSDIADYDAFVTADADAVPFLAAMNTTWRAVASTATVAAKDHTNTNSPGGVPIYLPNGVRLANDYDHLWGLPLLAPPMVTSSGGLGMGGAWTGTAADGTAATPLGASGGLATRGTNSTQATTWIQGSMWPQSITGRLYAISDVMTVPYPAVETIRVGTPANPQALLPGQASAPILGQTWDPIVDHTSFVPNAAIDVLFFGTAPVNVPVPGLGTALCAQVLGSTLTATPGQPFQLAIANDPTLLGVSLCTPALTIDATLELHVTNAIDITIGEF